MKRCLLLLLSLLLPSLLSAEFSVGDVPSSITIQGEGGGRIDGSSWSSSHLMGQLTLLTYVDPDERDLNENAMKAIDELKISKDQLKRVSIINMDATWIPSSLIKKGLKDAQKEKMDTIFVMDMEKSLVKKWDLEDDSNDILIISSKGRVLFSKDGELSEKDIKNMLVVLKENLP